MALKVFCPPMIALKKVPEVLEAHAVNELLHLLILVACLHVLAELWQAQLLELRILFKRSLVRPKLHLSTLQLV